MKGEIIRKAVHIAICVTYLFLINIINWGWLMIVLGVGMIILYYIRKTEFIRLIRSVRSINNFGEYYLFLGLMFTTLWYISSGKLVEIYIIILTLGLGDTLASFAKSKLFNSIILTVFCGLILIIFGTDTSIIFTISLLASLFIANWVSGYGTDNISIPLTLIICFSLQ